MDSASTVLFYRGLQFDHLFILLMFFFIASTLIWDTSDPRPHPFTVAARWVWTRGVKPAGWWLQYRVAVARWRHKARRAERSRSLPVRVPGTSWPLGGAS